MKRQLKSLVKGIVVGVLVGLFIIHGGPAYVVSLLQSNPEPVPDPVESEILTPILAPATTTATTSDEADVDTATTTATSADETTDTTATQYDDIEAVLDAIQAVFAREIAVADSRPLDWFSDTELSVLINPYTLTISGEQFCAEHASILNNLNIRHSERISLERDQLASAIDDYSEIRNEFTSSLATQQDAQLAELELLLQTLNQLATNRFGGDKYLAVSSTTRTTNKVYLQTLNDNTDTYLRTLRIERDRLSNILTSNIGLFDESVVDAIQQTKAACADTSANSAEILQVFEQDLRQAREVVQSSNTSDIQEAVAEAHTNYKAKLETAGSIRLSAFETLR